MCAWQPTHRACFEVASPVLSSVFHTKSGCPFEKLGPELGVKRYLDSPTMHSAPDLSDSTGHDASKLQFDIVKGT